VLDTLVAQAPEPPHCTDACCYAVNIR
jgi:hypothetical protein